MNIKPIKTDADYQTSLKEVESLMMFTAGIAEGEKLDVMVTLIEVGLASFCVTRHAWSDVPIEL